LNGPIYDIAWMECSDKYNFKNS